MDILITPSIELINLFNGDSCKSIGHYNVAVKQPTKYNHFYYIYENDSFTFFWGNHYEQMSDVDLLRTIQKYLETQEYRRILDMDGEFICGRFYNDERKPIEILTDREGIIPLYFKKERGGWSITTDQQMLFDDYKEKDINWRAVNDYLRFGCMIGCETLSERVNKAYGGSYIIFKENGTFFSKRLYKFHHNDSESCNDEDALIVEVADKCKKAIEKRIKGKEKNTCIFLSGGLDSRFLLAMTNQITDERITAYSFGQEYSEEVNVARSVAELKGNPFNWIKLRPRDFTQNVISYEKMVCGGDMFPQSYIIDATKHIKEECFMTGFCFELFPSGIFLNEDIIKYTGKFKDFVKDNLPMMKMSVLTKQDLLELCINEQSKDIFKYDIDSVLEEAKDYDAYAVSEVINAFVFENRDKNTVIKRNLAPAKYMDCIDPTFDRDFLSVASKIPSRMRLNYRFYQGLYEKVAEDYGRIVYNNTTLPALAPFDMWNEGKKFEAKRETEFEKLMADYNFSHKEKLYYPHFYSDFNGYSRYDEDWKKLFEKYLFADDAFLTHRIFNMEKLKDFYKEHTNGKKNRRKELIHIVSLEIFFKTMLRY